MLSFKSGIAALIALPIACSFLFVSIVTAQESIDPPPTAGPGKVMARAAAGTPTARIVARIGSLLAEEALNGNTPANTPLLAELEAAMMRHSPAVPAPKVTITNYGPGNLRIEKPDGSFVMLNSRFRHTYEIAGGGQTQLVAEFGNALIRLEHNANAQFQFWDGDDRLHTTIAPGSTPHDATLTNGYRGYHLER